MSEGTVEKSRCHHEYVTAPASLGGRLCKKCGRPESTKPVVQRKWQSITEEEYSVLRNAVMLHGKPLGWIVDTVETILKEKNYGA